jgi:serine protease Do
MFDRLLMIALLCVAAESKAAITLKLKENASITGTLLSEKQDHLVVDIGYTVLVVPRAHILETIHAHDSAGAASLETSPENTVPVSARASERRPRREGTVRELVQELGEAVVQIRTPGGLGSGFFISEDGFLITNFHVIEGETQIAIEVYHQTRGQLERRSYKQVRIVAMNKFADLALLKVEHADAPPFATVMLDDSDALAAGERVFAIGSPLGLERTVTEGIVSTTTRQIQGALYLQTTAQINPGNSGGPLFNLRGEVVGVTNMKITVGEGLGFAIPVSSVAYFLKHRDAYAYDTENPSNAYRYLHPPSRIKHPALAKDPIPLSPEETLVGEIHLQ